MKNQILSFTIKHKRSLIVAAAFLAVGFLLGNQSIRTNCSFDAADSCGQGQHEPDKHCADGPCTDEHSDQGHDHGHGSAEVDLDGLETLTCEHDVGILDCDDCRFEVGVVKIDPAVAAPLIQTGTIEKVDRIRVLPLTGQVQLDRTKTVDVVPAGGGRVKRVQTFLGDPVEKGDILAVIHSDDLGQAKADFLEIQSALELAETTFNREKNLYEKKISSQADYLAAQNTLSAAHAAYAAADKKLRLFGLETEQIATIREEKKNGSFADLILRAPQAGTVIAQHLSVGQIVDAAETICTLADLSSLWVWCDVYEKDLAVLHEHASKGKLLAATVSVKAFESAAFKGEVDFVGNLMDEHTRTVKMRVQVKNPEHLLRPGMFADVEVEIPLNGQMLAVPQTAVMTDAGEHFIFQHWKKDLWVRRDVAIGDRYGNRVELLSGVSQGANIVTGGAFMLKSDVLRGKMGAGCAD